MRTGPQDDERSAERRRSILVRAIRLALIVLALAVGTITIVALVVGEHVELPFDYEGFD